MTLGVVAFVVALLVSVMLHEAGHFLFARRFGMKATQFFVGFGPTLFSRRRGETEYGVKAIPAGGFVKIVGMTQLEKVDDADQPRAFYRQPAPQRTVVLAAGSVVHFVIGFVLLVFVLMALGLPKLSDEPVLGAISTCVPADGAQDCGVDSPASPAKAAGLREGDRVVSVAGRSTSSWDSVTQAIRDAGPGSARIVVERDGARSEITADLVARNRPSRADPDVSEHVGVLGVSPEQTLERTGPVDAAQTYGQLFVATFKALGAVPAAVPDLVRATFDGGDRSAEGLVGPVGIARVSGEALDSGDAPLAERLGTFLLIVAGLNVFVGVFNLLPLLPLDGGHLAVLGYEQARARVYRAVGRPDPGRVDLTKLLPAAYLFLALLVGLSVLLLAADIVNPVSLSL